MKLQVVISTIFFVFTFVKCDKDSSSSEEDIGAIVSVIYDLAKDEASGEKANLTALSTLVEKKCPGQFNAFEEALEEAVQCYKEEPIGDRTVCQYAKTKLKSCTTSTIKQLEKCVPEIQKDLPQFALDTIIAYVGYFCDSTGEKLLELANPCITQSIAPSCAAKVNERLTKYRNATLVTKKMICDAFTAFRPCVENDLVAGCKNEITKNAVIGLYSTIVDQCNTA